LEGEECWRLAGRRDGRVERARVPQREEIGGWRELEVSREKRLHGERAGGQQGKETDEEWRELEVSRGKRMKGGDSWRVAGREDHRSAWKG
jgi:hypothetical protein